jgi:arsenite-transporting ATPase
VAAVTPRTILYTGKGGVGKTSVAAATALRTAAAGQRTLVLSTDPAHSLGDALEAQLGPQPVQVADGLWGQQVDAQRELERHWSGVQGWLGDLLMERGVDRLSAEELTVPPGMDELFSLLQLKRAHDAREAWDVVVVDCAPTGETLRLLSFPDVARWWLDKVFPHEKQILAAARPLARSLLDIPVPSEAVFADVQRLSENLIGMNAILRDAATSSVRLVMNPDRIVMEESMRTFTYLNLYGYLTDAVLVNRVFPEEVDGYFAAWRERQQEAIATVESAFAPVPVLPVPYLSSEPVGADALLELGGVAFGDRDPAAVLASKVTQELSVSDDGALLRLHLPFTRKGDISLKKVGSELVVQVDGRKRTIMLPPALASFTAKRASFEKGALEVAFDAA